VNIVLTIIERESFKELKGKSLIVGFPGMAFVGKAVADVLINKLSLKEIAEIYSYEAPASIIVDNGRMTLPSIKIFSSPNVDIAVLTASYQPQSEEAQNRLAHEILRKLSDAGIKMVISAAAYVSPEAPEKRRVFVAATEERLVEEFVANGCVPMDGGISGLNGLLPAIAEVYGIDGVALLGETSELFVAGGLVDYYSATEVIRVLSSYLRLNVSLDDIIEKAKEVEESIRKAIARSAESEEKRGGEPFTHM
jgi:proteasome assembly chaperone (PAC2) family protein